MMKPEVDTSKLLKEAERLNKKLLKCEKRLAEMSDEFGEELVNGIDIDHDKLYTVESYQEMFEKTRSIRSVAWFLGGFGLSMLITNYIGLPEGIFKVQAIMAGVVAIILLIGVNLSEFSNSIPITISSAALELRLERRKLKYTLKCLNKAINTSSENKE